METGRRLNFNWENIYYSSSYTFSLYQKDNSAALATISSLSVPSVTLTFDPLTMGEFYWTVQGFTAPSEDRISRSGLIARSEFTIIPQPGAGYDTEASWSFPVIENIEIMSGQTRSMISLASPNSGITIPGLEALRSPRQARWTSEGTIRNTQLIISELPNPAIDTNATVVDASSPPVYFPSLKEGIWYWMIRGDTPDRRGAVSGEIFWFRVMPIPNLPAPRTVVHVDETVFTMRQLTEDKKIIFEWEQVAEANDYLFSLFRAGASNENSETTPPVNLLTVDIGNNLQYVHENMPLLNAQGFYYWQVEAVQRNENGEIIQRGTTRHHPFFIEYQRSQGFQTQTNDAQMFGH